MVFVVILVWCKLDIVTISSQHHRWFLLWLSKSFCIWHVNIVVQLSKLSGHKMSNQSLHSKCTYLLWNSNHINLHWVGSMTFHCLIYVFQSNTQLISFCARQTMWFHIGMQCLSSILFKQPSCLSCVLVLRLLLVKLGSQLWIHFLWIW